VKTRLSYAAGRIVQKKVVSSLGNGQKPEKWRLREGPEIGGTASSKIRQPMMKMQQIMPKMKVMLSVAQDSQGRDWRDYTGRGRRRRKPGVGLD
jgi:hypothetical protein